MSRRSALEVDLQATAASELLEKIADRTANAGPLLGAMADEMRKYEKYVFSSRGGSSKWRPTLSHKRRILVDSGDLLRSLTIKGAPGSVEHYTSDSVFVGTSNVAAIFQQKGRRGMPRRNPAPRPTRGRVKGWAKRALLAILEGE